MPTLAKPISDCEVRDPRIRRTRQLLQGALRSLMQSRSLEEISVQDIAELSTINRATFYDHYADKYALLEAMVAGGFHQMLHERNVLYDGTCPSAARAIILAACDYLELAHQGGSGGECTRHSAFEPLMDAAVAAAIRRVLVAGIVRNAASGGDATASASPEMVASAASWAIYAAVKEWFYTPERATSEKIVPQILQLILPILQSTGAGNSVSSGIESPLDALAAPAASA